MYTKTKIKKRITVFLVLCILMSIVTTTAFTVPAPDCTLQDSMKYLVEECGQRLRSSTNEDKAAAFVQQRFIDFGYTDIEWAKIPQVVTYYRLAFSQGPDVYGNASPATAAFGFTGQLVDLGTHTNYAVPAGVTGDIVGAVRFTAAPSAALLNGIITAVNANPGVNLTGILYTRSDGNSWYSQPSAVAANVPTLGTSLTNYNRALINAQYFEFADRYVTANTNAVIAKKPATSGITDLVIVVTAHMDCVAAGPGANDNATGTAGVIELARRFANVDTGNIELWFAAVGSEEGGGMAGAVYVANQIIAEGKRDIAINMNMDMIGSSPNARTGSGQALNAVSMDINVSAASAVLNLPSYLVTNFATDVDWADGIDNVRIYGYGGSDHTQFHSRGIDAASMIIVLNSNDDIENAVNGYHSGADNLDVNYSYERHIMCVDLMANGLWKAIDQQVSKRAYFEASFTPAGDRKIVLDNASSLFVTFNTNVTATFTGVSSGTAHNATFTKDDVAIVLPGGEDYTVSNVVARGAGIADNLDPVRNAARQNMVVNMVGTLFEAPIKVSLAGSTSVSYVGAFDPRNDTATYTVSMENLPNTGLWVKFKIIVDDTYFYATGTSALGGFGLMPGTVVWTPRADGMYEAIFEMFRQPVAYGDYDVFKVDFRLKDLTAYLGSNGKLPDITTTVKVEVVEIAAGTDWLSYRVLNVVHTAINHWYPTFDVNQDGNVDGRDIAFAMDYYMMSTTSPGWGEIAARCDVSGDGRVDIVDLVLIYANIT